MIAASRHHADDSVPTMIPPAAARFAVVAVCVVGLGFGAARGVTALTHNATRARIAPAMALPPVPASSFRGKLVAAPEVDNTVLASTRFGSPGSALVRSIGPCVQEASTHPARRIGGRRPGLHATAAHRDATQFDAVAIASLLHAVQRPAVRLRHRRTQVSLILATTRLQADGIAGTLAEATSPDVAAAVSHATKTAATPPSDPSLAFDTRLGRIKTAANAGVLNGQPAAALGIALTEGPIVLNATGMSEVTNLSEPGSFRKTFKVSTKASIPFD